MSNESTKVNQTDATDEPRLDEFKSGNSKGYQVKEEELLFQEIKKLQHNIGEMTKLFFIFIKLYNANQEEHGQDLSLSEDEGVLNVRCREDNTSISEVVKPFPIDWLT